MSRCMYFAEKVDTSVAWLLLLALQPEATAAGKAVLTRVRGKLMSKLVAARALG